MKLITKKFGEIRIRWQYNITDGDRDITKAFLEQKTGEKEITVLREVSVKRKPSEKYNKELARVFALTKLVKESFERGTALDDRKAIWEAYRTRSKKAA